MLKKQRWARPTSPADRPEMGLGSGNLVNLVTKATAQRLHNEAMYFKSSLWFLVGNGGMDPYDNPLKLKVPYSSPNNLFLHSLLRTRESWRHPENSLEYLFFLSCRVPLRRQF